MLDLDAGKIMSPGVNLRTLIRQSIDVILRHQIMGSPAFPAYIKFLFQKPIDRGINGIRRKCGPLDTFVHIQPKTPGTINKQFQFCAG
jgi:hypothetical protein